MSVLDSDSTTLATIIEDRGFDEAQVAAAAFLARYNGRTLNAYRYDLRTFFQWAADAGLAVLEAKRPHIELYRTAMEHKGLAPSTIDRRRWCLRLLILRIAPRDYSMTAISGVRGTATGDERHRSWITLPPGSCTSCQVRPSTFDVRPVITEVLRPEYEAVAGDQGVSRSMNVIGGQSPARATPVTSNP